ncbi:hypothetical protein [Tepidibacillus marianensis]|uniref:hypothetical protein n=1 Tax=Tepidibacillus marianensis TaxID=3131995 RepID=UPI0030D58BD4
MISASNIMKDIAVMQIIKIYEATKGPAPKEFIEAIKKASASELSEVASYLPTIIQTAMWNRIWQDYEEQRKKQGEQSGQMAIIKKCL